MKSERTRSGSGAAGPTRKPGTDRVMSSKQTSRHTVVPPLPQTRTRPRASSARTQCLARRGRRCRRECRPLPCDGPSGRYGCAHRTAGPSSRCPPSESPRPASAHTGESQTRLGTQRLSHPRVRPNYYAIHRRLYLCHAPYSAVKIIQIPRVDLCTVQNDSEDASRTPSTPVRMTRRSCRVIASHVLHHAWSSTMLPDGERLTDIPTTRSTSVYRS